MSKSTDYIKPLRHLVYLLCLFSILIGGVALKIAFEYESNYVRPKKIASVKGNPLNRYKPFVAPKENFSYYPLPGQQIFKMYCNSCHQIGKAIAAPNLVGVTERWADKELLFQFIKNPQSVIDQEDPYTIALMEEWQDKGGLMPPQDLTDKQIEQILMYLTDWVPVICFLPEVISCP